MHANRVPDKNLVSKIHNFSRGHDLTAEYRGEKRRRARVCARKRGREKRFFFSPERGRPLTLDFPIRGRSSNIDDRGIPYSSGGKEARALDI